jgi:hypothetical protein
MRTGRPPIPIDWSVFEKLCGLQCTLVEMARFYRCSEDTIQRAVARHYKEKGRPAPTFAEIQKRFGAEGLISLRRAQFTSALGDQSTKRAPNITMQIWLGKQHLGQADKVEVADPFGDGRDELDKMTDEELMDACKPPTKKKRG